MSAASVTPQPGRRSLPRVPELAAPAAPRRHWLSQEALPVSIGVLAPRTLGGLAEVRGSRPRTDCGDGHSLRGQFDPQASVKLVTNAFVAA